MSGVIVSVKGRYAVLLTKNSDFIKVKNKNYSVGDKVKIPQYKGQILAAAASFIVVCGGIFTTGLLIQNRLMMTRRYCFQKPM